MAASTLDIHPDALCFDEREIILPAYSLEARECAYQVGRRQPEYRKSWILRLLLWLQWQVWNVEPCLPCEYIGLALTEEEADAACLDATYFYFPQPVGLFLPAGRQRIKGLKWPRRTLSPRVEPPTPQYLINVPLAEWERLKGIESRIDKLVSSVRAAL